MRSLPFLLLAALPFVPAMAKDPPRTLFISPMGQPFRTDDGMPEAEWFKAVDRDGDGKLTLTEFTLDAARFFALLDVDHDGKLSPEEITRYETEIAPEVAARGFGRGGDGAGGDGGGGHMGGGMGGGRRGGGGGHMGGGMGGGGMGGGGMGGGGFGGGGGGRRGGGGGGGMRSGGGGGFVAPLRGAGRYGYIDTPEPVTSAATDFSDSVTRAEFLAAAGRRFSLLDADGDGSITQRELPQLKANPDRGRRALRPAQPPSGDDF